MVLRSIITLTIFLFITTNKAFSQENSEYFGLEDIEVIPYELDSIHSSINNQEELVLPINVFNPRLEQMVPMPYAKIDSTTEYPMLIKKYKLFQTEKKNSVKMTP